MLPALKKVGHVHRLTDEETMLNAPSDSTNVIVKLHIFDNLPNVEAKGAKTWVKNLLQIENAGLEDHTKFISWDEPKGIGQLSGL